MDMFRAPMRALLMMGVFVTALVAAACGGSTTTSGTEPTADIQIYEQKDAPNESLLKQQITEFQGLHKTITVKVVNYQTESLRTNFQTAAIAPRGP